MTAQFAARAPGAGASVLVVEDDPGIATQLVRGLTRGGYQVDHVTTGAEALARGVPDVVLLDLELPDGDGVNVCRALRERSPVAIIVVTAYGEEADRVNALDAGADDYLVKPFALRELLARVRALLRRAGEDDDKDEVLTFADLRLDLRAHEAWRGERALTLTRTEFLLLELFMRHPRQVLTRSAIFESVWGYDFGSSSNSLGVYMGYLRRKTEVGEEPRLLHTVRGVGYVLRAPA